MNRNPTTKPKKKTKRKASDLERAFDHWWNLLGDPAFPYVCEHRFTSPKRWRFDKAFLNQKVAIELQGGTFIQGAHSRGVGQRNDAEKNNAAVRLGWRVLYFTTDMLHDDPAGCIAAVLAVLRQTPV